MKLPEREHFLLSLSQRERAALLYDWEGTWARPEQIPPSTDWHTWLIRAGRGFGKTRVGAEMVRKWAKSLPHGIINIIGRTQKDVRETMIQGESGILAVCPDEERPIYKEQKGKLYWPNGCTSLTYTAEEPDAFRGPQCHKAWCDELASWKYPDASWDNAMFGLRLGQSPQVVVTTTPQNIKLIQQLCKDPGVFQTRGSTYDNRANLSSKFFSRIVAKYEGTRLGRQEIHGELLDDNPDGLWQASWFERAGFRIPVLPSGMDRIVVAIDPSVTAKEESDECGIGCAARKGDEFFVIDDLTGIMSPRTWAETAVALYKRRGADRIIAETNNGGDMVETMLRAFDMFFAYRGVHAKRGKAIRAEPVAALYEQGRVHHVGTLAELEAELLDFNPKTYTESPNRMDWLVYALTDLVESGGALAVMDFVTEELEKLKRSDSEMYMPEKTLAKIETNSKTPQCPQCGSLAATAFKGGWRCQMCMKQWGRPEPEVSVGTPGRGLMK